MSEGAGAGGDRSAARIAWEALSRDLLGEAQYTAVELSEKSGVSGELLTRLWQSLGFPPVPLDERVFTDSDVTTVRDLVGLSGDTPDEGLVVQLTRMAGQTQARLAESVAELLTERSRPAPADAIAATDAPADVGFVKGLEPLLSYVWRRHLLASLGRHLLKAGDTSARSLVVGFADLVSFTALTRRLQDGHLAGVVERFEALVYAHVPHNRGRIIKFLGDEVLFVADSPADAAAIGLGLVESIAADPDLPEIRAGLALGPVVALGGDVFGQTVNLASRLVDEARPSTVLVSEELGAALADNPTYATPRLRGRLNLKGIGRVHAHVLRHPKPEPEKKQKKKERDEKKRAAKKKRRRTESTEASEE